MAQPTNPLIIWAEDNVNLPVTGQPNKSAPQEALRKTGWDEGQKPSCEEFNYILNNLAQYINYYGTEKTQEFLTKAANLSDLTDVVAARNNLSVYSQAQVDAKQINTGAGLTGGGDLSTNRTISMATPSTVGAGSINSATNSGVPTHTHALDVTGNVSILTGEISNGGTIPLPSGYTQSQCKWFVSPAYIEDNASSDDLKNFTCRVNSSRVVTVLGESSGSGQSANYIIIGVK